MMETPITKSTTDAIASVIAMVTSFLVYDFPAVVRRTRSAFFLPYTLKHTDSSPLAQQGIVASVEYRQSNPELYLEVRNEL